MRAGILVGDLSRVAKKERPLLLAAMTKGVIHPVPAAPELDVDLNAVIWGIHDISTAKTGMTIVTKNADRKCLFSAILNILGLPDGVLSSSMTLESGTGSLFCLRQGDRCAFQQSF